MSPQFPTYIYEPHRNLKTSVINSVGGEIISQYDYIYDAGARRTSVKHSGKAFEQEKFNKYGYNDRSEVIESSRYAGSDLADMSNPITNEYRSYQYDNIGNREKAIDWDKTDKDLRTTYYESNSLNQYEQTNDGKDQSNFVYDADGNLTSVISSNGDVMMYTYNCENRLIAAGPANPNEGDLKGEYLYDYMGRRIRKKVYEFNNMEWKLKETRLFVWDDWNMIEEVVLFVAEEEHSKYHIWGAFFEKNQQETFCIATPIISIENAKMYYYFYNDSKNVSQLIDFKKANIVINYQYSPFGQFFNKDFIILKDTISFFSKYHDFETGFGLWGYRYYYSKLGKWINRDPNQERGNIIFRLHAYRFDQEKGFHFNYLNKYGLNIDFIDYKKEINLYVYVLNNPGYYFDIKGLKANFRNISGVVMHRRHKKWKIILGIESGDGYGHWWVKMGGESYGWWPKAPVDFWSTLIGTQGELNGRTNFGGSAIRDPHHFDTGAEEYFAPKSSWRGILKFGTKKGISCLCVSDNSIKDCIRAFAKNFDNENNRWSYPVGPNCHTFQVDMMKQCCMSKN